MTSSAVEEQTQHILSDTDAPAPESRQGVARRAKALAACGVLAAVALAGWQAYGGHARPSTSSAASGAPNFLQGKAEEADGRKALDKSDKSFDSITKMKATSEEHMKTAKAAEGTAKSKKQSAEKAINASIQQITKAGKDSDKADAQETAANSAIDAAHAVENKSADEIATAKDTIAKAKAEAEAAKKGSAKADSMQKEAQAKKEKVAVVEKQAMNKTAEGRVCIDLPGVELKDAEGKDEFAPIATKKETDTAEACTLWCKEHEGCAQAKFTEWGKSCKLFKETSAEPKSFRDGFGASYCGAAGDKKKLEDMKKTVMAFKPDIPPVVDCAWDGEDCSESSCCNDETCDWEFQECKPSTCYGGADGASCMSACYGDQCEEKGTGREMRETPAAEDGVLTQGTTLYCFMAVAWSKEGGRDQWSDTEAALANNIEEKKAGIYQCDDSEVFEAGLTAVTDWDTYLNADMFIDIWKQVQKSGKYAGSDWTVKVDVDAVFFPGVLKQHLANLKTPQGSRVYLRNIEYKYGFLGPLQVLTREAVDLYFEKGWVCESKDHEKFTEDYYMKHCLDAIGCDHQVDTDLLSDKATDTKGKQDCSNGWAAALHFQRSVDDWNKCYDKASAAQEEARKLWISEHPQ